MIKRPWCCLDPDCIPLHQLKDWEYPDLSVREPGQSWLCLGKMPKPVAFTYEGVEHENNLNECSHTPLKGIIRNQGNRQDWAALAATYQIALGALSSMEHEDGST